LRSESFRQRWNVITLTPSTSNLYLGFAGLRQLVRERRNERMEFNQEVRRVEAVRHAGRSSHIRFTPLPEGSGDQKR